MSKTVRNYRGSILWLRCEVCGTTFPHFQFEGEGDSDTNGLCSASTCLGPEIVLIYASPQEWNSYDAGGREALEKRIREETGRDDFRIIRIVEIEQKAPFTEGMSFKQFFKSYTPPILRYTCPCSSMGRSVKVKEQTIDDFTAGGGKLIPIGMDIEY